MYQYLCRYDEAEFVCEDIDKLQKTSESGVFKMEYEPSFYKRGIFDDSLKQDNSSFNYLKELKEKRILDDCGHLYVIKKGYYGSVRYLVTNDELDNFIIKIQKCSKNYGAGWFSNEAIKTLIKTKDKLEFQKLLWKL